MASFDVYNYAPYITNTFTSTFNFPISSVLQVDGTCRLRGVLYRKNVTSLTVKLVGQKYNGRKVVSSKLIHRLGDGVKFSIGDLHSGIFYQTTFLLKGMFPFESAANRFDDDIVLQFPDVGALKIVGDLVDIVIEVQCVSFKRKFDNHLHHSTYDVEVAKGRRIRFKQNNITVLPEIEEPKESTSQMLNLIGNPFEIGTWKGFHVTQPYDDGTGSECGKSKLYQTALLALCSGYNFGTYDYSRELGVDRYSLVNDKMVVLYDLHRECDAAHSLSLTFPEVCSGVSVSIVAGKIGSQNGTVIIPLDFTHHDTTLKIETFTLKNHLILGTAKKTLRIEMDSTHHILSIMKATKINMVNVFYTNDMRTGLFQSLNDILSFE